MWYVYVRQDVVRVVVRQDVARNVICVGEARSGSMVVLLSVCDGAGSKWPPVHKV